MDPVSAAVLGWLTDQAATAGARGLKRLVLGDEVRNALRKVARAAVEATVREVVSPEQRDDVLDALLREGPDRSDVQVAEAFDLPEAIMAHMSPRLTVLADQGYDVDDHRLTEVLCQRVMAGIRANAVRNGPLRPLEELLRGDRLSEAGEAAARELERANRGLDQVSVRLRQVQADVAALFDQLEIMRPGTEGDIAARKPQFTGREWLFGQVDDLLWNNRRGGVCAGGRRSRRRQVDVRVVAGLYPPVCVSFHPFARWPGSIGRQQEPGRPADHRSRSSEAPPQTIEVGGSAGVIVRAGSSS